MMKIAEVEKVLHDIPLTVEGRLGWTIV